MTGYDYSLESPKYNSVYRPKVNRISRSSIIIVLFFLLLRVGLSVLGFMLYLSIASAEASKLTIESRSLTVESLFSCFSIGNTAHNRINFDILNKIGI